MRFVLLPPRNAGVRTGPSAGPIQAKTAGMSGIGPCTGPVPARVYKGLADGQFLTYCQLMSRKGCVSGSLVFGGGLRMGVLQACDYQ